MSEPELTRIGPYKLETKLARGGFGNIWQAREDDTGREVAIKVLHPELVVSEAIVMRFEREARSIAKLEHPHVVELFEFGKLAGNRPYIVMELLHGPNLERYIRQNGALRPRQILAILEQLCSALSIAHENGIIHRDLKASNVVFSHKDDTDRVVLLDFGIAKLLESGEPNLTASRVTIGSPVCMAPEQITGNSIDSRTDVYALGSLTFLMLTGELPFPGSSLDTMQQHLNAPRPRPSDRMDVLPVYDDLTVKAMAKRPEDRYDSVTAFLNAFRYSVELDEASSATIEVPSDSRARTGTAVSCIGLYVEVVCDQQELDDPDEALLDDMDAVHPRAAGFLERRGFLLAYESGDSALFVLPLPELDSDARQIRKRTLDHVLELHDVLQARDGRDLRLRVGLHLHVDRANLSRGLVTDGALLDITHWVKPRDGDGISMTLAMADGMDTGALPDTVQLLSG